ncbi:MAG: OmpH family outer membrane protein [Bacteroidia bacterium]|nr:OmpH family outer membrane protein [Bacteroidia bacterium]
MKKLVVKVFALCMLLTGFGLKAQKTAHVDLDSLLAMMPESKTAQDRMTAKLNELQTFLASLKTKYDEVLANFQAKGPTMSQMESNDAQEELARMEQRIQQRQQEAQQDYQAFSATMQKPIFEKVNKAIETVAKENKYNYVLSKAEGLVLYADPADDITGLVKKKMDTMPLAKLPEGAGGGGGIQKPGGGGVVKPKPGAGGGK